MQQKPIKGYENYVINEIGEIFNSKTGQAKKPTLASNGYYLISLYKNNKPKYFHVHKLLAESFIENPHDLPIVNHKDGIKVNNNLDNLEWSTYSHNNQHAYDTGLKVVSEKVREHARTMPDMVVELYPEGTTARPLIFMRDNYAETFPSVKKAAEHLGLATTSVHRAIKECRTTRKGFSFRYSEGD